MNYFDTDNEYSAADILKIKQKKKNAIKLCLMVMLVILCITTYCGYKIMPFFGEFLYETKINHLALPELTEPSIVNVRISYLGAAPKNIKVSHDGTEISFMHDLEIVQHDADKKIDITFDTNELGKYELSLIPQDNYELRFETTVNPSPHYLVGEVVPYRAKNGDYWAMITATYNIKDSQLKLSIWGDGSRYRPTICDIRFKSGQTMYINISELMRALSVKTEEMSGVNIIVNESTNTIKKNINETCRFSDWCDYDKSFDELYSFNMKDTNQYLLSLPDSAFNYHRNDKDNGLEPAASEDTEKENTEIDTNNSEDTNVEQQTN